NSGADSSLPSSTTMTSKVGPVCSASEARQLSSAVQSLYAPIITLKSGEAGEFRSSVTIECNLAKDTQRCPQDSKAQPALLACKTMIHTRLAAYKSTAVLARLGLMIDASRNPAKPGEFWTLAAHLLRI